MAKAIELTNIHSGEDKFAVVNAQGVILSTHPRMSGAKKLAERFNATGSL